MAPFAASEPVTNVQPVTGSTVRKGLATIVMGVLVRTVRNGWGRYVMSTVWDSPAPVMTVWGSPAYWIALTITPIDPPGKKKEKNSLTLKKVRCIFAFSFDKDTSFRR